MLGQSKGLIEKIKKFLYTEINISSIIPNSLRPYWFSLVNFLNKDISTFFSTTSYDVSITTYDVAKMNNKKDLNAQISDPQYFHFTTYDTSYDTTYGIEDWNVQVTDPQYFYLPMNIFYSLFESNNHFD
jgi:hypothetical protein